jgi:general secretion pathway protein A
MYTKFFGLTHRPFALTADPGFLLFTPQHREVLAGLTYAIVSRKGLVVLTGDAGTGKTTLLRKVLQSLPPNTVQSSFILNPSLTPDEFLEMTLNDFGVTDIPSSKTQRILRLNKLLLDAFSEGKTCVLIVDEAHKLSPEVLEEIRLLSNFEKADEKLVQIVLAGQTELGGLLNRADLRQFKQRIALRLRTDRLSTEEVELYVQYRWAKAGGGATTPFDTAALACVALWSAGIPRLINVICDNSLLLAFSEGTRAVTVSHVREACTDLDLLDANGRRTAAPLLINDGAVRTPAAATNGTKPQPDSEHEPVAGTALLRRLDRQGGRPQKPSFVTKWATRLGLAQRAI